MTDIANSDSRREELLLFFSVWIDRGDVDPESPTIKSSHLGFLAWKITENVTFWNLFNKFNL